MKIFYFFTPDLRKNPKWHFRSFRNCRSCDLTLQERWLYRAGVFLFPAISPKIFAENLRNLAKNFLFRHNFFLLIIFFISYNNHQSFLIFWKSWKYFSSAIYIWFIDSISKMYISGTINMSHATNPPWFGTQYYRRSKKSKIYFNSRNDFDEKDRNLNLDKFPISKSNFRRSKYGA